MKELAQVMFEAYNAQGPNPNKTWDGKEVPPWSAVGEQVQAKWRAAANAAVIVETSPSGRFDFGGALKVLKLGRRVKREVWHGEGIWLAIQTPDPQSKMGLPYIYMSVADGKLVPWLASQTDMLASDWVLAE